MAEKHLQFASVKAVCQNSSSVFTSIVCLNYSIFKGDPSSLWHQTVFTKILSICGILCGW